MNFKSELIKNLSVLFGIKKISTSSYHPQSNGEIEQFNKTLKSMLSKYVNDGHKDWDDYLAQVTYAYNTASHDVTRVLPHTVLFGKSAREFDVNCSFINNNRIDTYVDKLKRTSQRSQRSLKQNSKK